MVIRKAFRGILDESDDLHKHGFSQEVQLQHLQTPLPFVPNSSNQSPAQDCCNVCSLIRRYVCRLLLSRVLSSQPLTFHIILRINTRTSVVSPLQNDLLCNMRATTGMKAVSPPGEFHKLDLIIAAEVMHHMGTK